MIKKGKSYLFSKYGAIPKHLITNLFSERILSDSEYLLLLTKIIDDKDAFSLAFGISDSKILKLFLKEIRSKQHVYREKLDTIAAAFALLYHIDMLPTSFLELLAISAPSIIFHIQYLPLHIRVIAAAEISKVNQDAFIFSCNAIKSQSEKLRRYLFYIFSRNVKIAEEVLPLG